MRGALLALVLALSPALAWAQTKAQDVDALLEAMQLDKRVASSNRLMRVAIIRGLRSRASAGSNPRVHELIEEEYDAAFPVSRLMAEVRPKVAGLFDASFTHEEVRELTAHFRSPVYAKYRDLNDDVGKLILTAIQASVKAGMGDLMKRVTDRAIAEGVKK